MCGVTNGPFEEDTIELGLSPRVRSYPCIRGSCFFLRRSISACAELPAGLPIKFFPYEVYLRVCGVTEQELADKIESTGLSPRVRSYRKAAVQIGSYKRSISACAELPPWELSASSSAGVYLRVCGVTDEDLARSKRLLGLSPRVRSYRTELCDDIGEGGSISACAELPQRTLHPCAYIWVYLRVCGVTPATICRNWVGNNANCGTRQGVCEPFWQGTCFVPERFAGPSGLTVIRCVEPHGPFDTAWD